MPGTNAYSARLLTNPLAAHPIAFTKQKQAIVKIKLQCVLEKIVLSFQNFSMTLVNKKLIYRKFKNNPGPYYELALYRHPNEISC